MAFTLTHIHTHGTRKSAFQLSPLITSWAVFNIAGFCRTIEFVAVFRFIYSVWRGIITNKRWILRRIEWFSVENAPYCHSFRRIEKYLQMWNAFHDYTSAKSLIDFWSLTLEACIYTLSSVLIPISLEYSLVVASVTSSFCFFYYVLIRTDCVDDLNEMLSIVSTHALYTHIFYIYKYIYSFMKKSPMFVISRSTASNILISKEQTIFRAHSMLAEICFTNQNTAHVTIYVDQIVNCPYTLKFIWYSHVHNPNNSSSIEFIYGFSSAAFDFITVRCTMHSQSQWES